MCSSDLPLLLAWPTSTPVAGDAINRLGAPSADTLASGASAKDLFPLLPHWPPPPFILGLFVFPIVREGYKRLFSQFSKWVLGSTSGTGEEHGQGQQRAERDMHRVLLGAVAEDEPFLRIRVNAHVDEEDALALPQGRRANRGARPNGNENGDGEGADADDAGDVAAAAEDTIRVSGTSIGRLIGGAMIIPRISSLMGSLLFRLSKHSVWLRRFLAIRPPLRAAERIGPLGLTTGRPLGTGLGGLLGTHAVLGEVGLLRKLGVAGMLGLSVAWRGTYAWAECDPVWCVRCWSFFSCRVLTVLGRWRNSLGLGLFTIVSLFFVS